jgi:hypothetical protein
MVVFQCRRRNMGEKMQELLCMLIKKTCARQVHGNSQCVPAVYRHCPCQWACQVQLTA